MNMKSIIRSIISLILAILCVLAGTPSCVQAAGTYTLHFVDDLQNTDALYSEFAGKMISRSGISQTSNLLYGKS